MFGLTILPNAVEDPAVGEDAHVHVGYDDRVEVALSFVGEEQIGHPHFARIGQRQVLEFAFQKQNSHTRFSFNTIA